LRDGLWVILTADRQFYKGRTIYTENRARRKLLVAWLSSGGFLSILKIRCAQKKVALLHAPPSYPRSPGLHSVTSRLLKKTHMPSACLKQAFRIVALNRCGDHSRSKRSRSNVPPKYASARQFFARRSAVSDPDPSTMLGVMVRYSNHEAQTRSELGRSLASEIFLTSLQTAFFSSLLEVWKWKYRLVLFNHLHPQVLGAAAHLGECIAPMKRTHRIKDGQ